MSEYIITDKQFKTATEAYLEHELSRPITEVFISGDKLPQIVRCMDCKHYVPEYGYSEERGFGQVEYMMEPPACARSKAIQITVDPNGFCAWGERRD